MGRLKEMLQQAAIKLLDIRPANPKPITIYEKDTYESETLRNRLWYRGDPNELEQYFKRIAKDRLGSAKTKFWAAEPTKDSAIRKMHTGLPKMIANKLSDIVIADMDKIELDGNNQNLWDAISKDNKFPQLVGTCIAETLVDGDGAFKVSIDTDLSNCPIIEFYGGERISYILKRGRLQQIIFHTIYTKGLVEYCLHEHYGRGYIDYKLYNARGDEVKLGIIEDCSGLKPHNTFTGDFIMGLPIMFFKSVKYKGRGDSIFSSKNDNFDALDEVVSQWIDAIRKGRVYRYIPKSMVPRDSDTGEILSPNVFDNDYVEAGTSLAEDAKEVVTLSQAEIKYEAYVESYACFMDMCLQGIISPGTLGIDLKKTDNSESQREKEKATITSCNKIVDVLTEVIPELVSICMMTYDVMCAQTCKKYQASIKFGEYGTPTFDKVVETVVTAKTGGVMSTKQALKQMYGDTWTDKEIEEELQLIKADEGISLLEPGINEFDELGGTVPTKEDYQDVNDEKPKE